MKARQTTILILAVLVAAEVANGQTEGSSGGDATATKLEEEAQTDSDETQVTVVHFTCTILFVTGKEIEITKSKNFLPMSTNQL